MEHYNLIGNFNMKEYTCKDCVMHDHDDEPTECKEQDLEHKPCKDFHPSDYIKALNYDTN